MLEGEIDVSHIQKHFLDAAVGNVFKRFCVGRAKGLTVRDEENLRAGYHVVVLFLHRITQAGTLRLEWTHVEVSFSKITAIHTDKVHAITWIVSFHLEK